MTKKNPYHRHKSKGTQKKSGKPVGKLRCPITGILISSGSSKCVIEEISPGHTYSLCVVRI